VHAGWREGREAVAKIVPFTFGVPPVTRTQRHHYRDPGAVHNPDLLA
jgi:hypothetical protein